MSFILQFKLAKGEWTCLFITIILETKQLFFTTDDAPRNQKFARGWWPFRLTRFWQIAQLVIISLERFLPTLECNACLPYDLDTAVVGHQQQSVA